MHMPTLSLRGIATAIFSFLILSIIGAIISANIRTFLSKRGWDTYLNKLADHPNIAAIVERCRRIAGWGPLRRRWWLWLALGLSGGVAATLWTAPTLEIGTAAVVAPIQQSRIVTGNGSILVASRFYSAKNKEEVAARLDKISDTINKADQGMLVPANQVLLQRFLARPVAEAGEYLEKLDGIKASAKAMDASLYDDLLANERDYRAEMNAILFPKEPLVYFMVTADEYRNSILVWMKLSNGITENETNREFQQLVMASARSFAVARDEFVRWLSQRQELIGRARRDLRS
jgi:hypothetical protein